MVMSAQAIGVVTPFDLELDRELWRWCPEDVDLLLTRTPFQAGRVDVPYVEALADAQALADGVRAVTAGRAGVVAYTCTAGSFVHGRQGEADLRAAMTAAGADEAVTTSGAILEALEALGARSVSVATPYIPELSKRFAHYLEESGVAVAGLGELNLEREIWNADYDQTTRLARLVDSPGADAIVIACTNLRSYDIIDALEQQQGKPVVSANEATMWASLRRIGRQAQGRGSLLEID